MNPVSLWTHPVVMGLLFSSLRGLDLFPHVLILGLLINLLLSTGCFRCDFAHLPNLSFKMLCGFCLCLFGTLIRPCSEKLGNECPNGGRGPAGLTSYHSSWDLGHVRGCLRPQQLTCLHLHEWAQVSPVEEIPNQLKKWWEIIKEYIFRLWHSKWLIMQPGFEWGPW